MIRFIFFIFSVLCTGAALADTIVPVRTIRASAIISEADVKVVPETVAGAVDRLDIVLGQEARTTLYAGRPVRFDEIGPPAIVARNQIVPLRFETAGLVITTEGRSLERGAVGDRIRVMNLDSRATLFGQVRPDGSVHVFR